MLEGHEFDGFEGWKGGRFEGLTKILENTQQQGVNLTIAGIRWSSLVKNVENVIGKWENTMTIKDRMRKKRGTEQQTLKREGQKMCKRK